jgi:hypothetical protein
VAGGETQQPAEEQQQKMPSGLSNLGRLLNNGHATDPNTGEDIPLNFSGNTPDTAMNKSPLSAMERMKLSLGNEAGNINFLKSRFQDVQHINDEKGQPTSDLAVLDKGTWYRINPINGEIKDPWEKTKEYMTDAATYSPEAAGLGVGLVVDKLASKKFGPIGRAAAAGAAAAVTSGVRTVLGRAIGTYDATPEEQVWDSAFEGILNAAGVAVLGGVKPTASWVAGKLPKIAEFFAEHTPQGVKTVAGAMSDTAGKIASSVANSPKAMFRTVFAKYSVGDRAFETMVKNYPELSATMKSLAADGGSDYQVYKDRAVVKQLKSVQGMADSVRGTLSDIYGSMRNKLLAKVPQNFAVNVDEAVYSAYSDAVERGIGSITVGDKTLTGKAAMDYIAEKGLYKARFNFLSQADLQRQFQRTGQLDKGVGALVADKEAHAALAEFYANLDKFVGAQKQTGVNGAQSLLDFKKVASDLSRTMGSSDSIKNNPEIKMILDKAKVRMDESIRQEFAKHGAGQEFLDLNSTYDRLSDNFAPLLKAKKIVDKTGNLKSFQPILDDITGPNGAVTRDAIETAVREAQANGLSKRVEELTAQQFNIDLHEAAKQWNPIKPGMYKADKSEFKLGGAIKKPFTSTTLAQTGATAEITGRALAQGFWQGQQYLTSLPRAHVGNLVNYEDGVWR